MGGTSSLLCSAGTSARWGPRDGALIPGTWGGSRLAVRPANFNSPYLGLRSPDRLAGCSPGLGGLPSSFAQNNMFFVKTSSLLPSEHLRGPPQIGTASDWDRLRLGPLQRTASEDRLGLGPLQRTASDWDRLATSPLTPHISGYRPPVA